MGRYLLYFSYIGSSFSGSQAQVVGGSHLVRTVQGVIEKAFGHIKLIDRGRLSLASRTDTGVHALGNCLHVDATYSKEGMKEVREPDPKMFMYGLNSVFDRYNEPIRVWKSLRVSPEFHCRTYAKSREYLYRLAVMQPETSKIGLLAPITAVEVNRCLVYGGDFDEKLLFLAAEMFNGIHCFSKFTTAESLQDKGGNGIRPMVVSVKKSQPIIGEHWPIEAKDAITYYDILFRSSSFLYNQIRRMVGCLLQISSKRISLEVLESLLKGEDVPPSIPHPTPTASPCGLYLKEIEYRPEDLILPENAILSDEFPASVLRSFTKRVL